MNYFSLFDIPEQYEVNIVALEQRYKMLQRLTHPDRYVNASDQEKRMYMQKNSQINDGYYVLQDMVLRGEHLLEVRGIELSSEQETIGDTTFLMEQMDLREDLASAQEPAEFEALNSNISDSIAGYIDRITGLFETNLETDVHAARLELRKLKFLKKIAAEAKARERNETK
ncbi:MAG: molecular chaperone HscB [Alphaproteobacteria bacterium]|jgi:molecular chaperone HscB